MKQILLIICILGFIIPINAAEKSDYSVTLNADWNIGDKIHININTETTNLSNKSAVVINKDIQLTVLEKTEKGYVIEWLIQKVELDSAKPMLSRELAKINEGLKIVYAVNKTGAYLEILNKSDIYNFFNRAVDFYEKLYIDKPGAKNLLESLADIYSNDVHIETLVSPEIQALHFLYGAAYKLGKTTYLQTLLPNALGGKPLPAYCKIDLEKLPNKSYKINISQKPDKERATEMLNNLSMTASNAETAEYSDLNVEDSAEHFFNNNSTWAEKIIVTRKLEIPGGKGQISKTVYLISK